MGRGQRNFFHLTKEENIKSIRKRGIVADSSKGLTEAGDWAKEYYPFSPVYISVEPGKSKHVDYRNPNSSQAILNFSIDSSELLPDLPALVDAGGIIDNDGIYWETPEEEPEALSPFLEDGFVSFDDLLNNQELIRTAVKATGTAAVQSIAAEKIMTISQHKR